MESPVRGDEEEEFNPFSEENSDVEANDDENDGDATLRPSGRLGSMGSWRERFPETTRDTINGANAAPSLDDSVTVQCVFEFDVALGIAERDAKGGYSPVPHTSDGAERDVFKLRTGFARRVTLKFTEVGSSPIVIQRCVGVLACPGQGIRSEETLLFDMVSAERSASDPTTFEVTGEWDDAQTWPALKQETPKGAHHVVTFAADVVLTGLDDPVRVTLEAKVRIYKHSERFWQYGRVLSNPFRYALAFEQLPPELASGADAAATVAASMGGAEGPLSPSIGGVSSIRRTSNTSTSPYSRMDTGTRFHRSDESVDTFGDVDGAAPNSAPSDPQPQTAPVPVSGSGAVRDVSAERWSDWTAVLANWDDVPRKRVTQLVRCGVPEQVRGRVWCLLAGMYDGEFREVYRYLSARESPCEDLIVADMNRTFSAHDYFKEGVGQDTLLRLCRAYSVYDEEIGYVQGLSFILAVLLLHVPEEDAFGLMVKLMFDYGLRDLYKKELAALHVRFYQLERLMQDFVPDVAEHFRRQGVEVEMFASQWFLTLFSSKFPLDVAYYAMDLFLGDGMETLFRVSLAMLTMFRKEVVAMTFEQLMSFFRIDLPRRFTDAHQHYDSLVESAILIRLSSKKVAQYEKDYHAGKGRDDVNETNAVKRMEKENVRLKERNAKLEKENEALAADLVKAKVSLTNRVEKLTEQNAELREQMRASEEKHRAALKDAEDQIKALESELHSVKGLYRSNIGGIDEERKRTQDEVASVKMLLRVQTDKSEREIALLNKEIAVLKRELARARRRLSTASATSDRSSVSGDAAHPSSSAAAGDHLGVDHHLAARRLSSQEEAAAEEELSIASDIPPADENEPASAREIELERALRAMEEQLAKVKLQLVDAQCEREAYLYEKAQQHLASASASSAAATSASGGAAHEPRDSKEALHAFVQQLPDLKDLKINKPAWMKKVLGGKEK